MESRDNNCNYETRCLDSCHWCFDGSYNPVRFCRCPILSSLRNSKQIHWCPLLQSITMEVPNSLLCGEQNVTMEPLLIHCSLLYRVLFFVVAFFPTEGQVWRLVELQYIGCYVELCANWFDTRCEQLDHRAHVEPHHMAFC